MKEIDLVKLMTLFKGPKAYNKFRDVLKSHLEGRTMTPIVDNDKLIGSLVSAEVTKDILYERLANNLKNTPDIFEVLNNSFEGK